MIRFKDYSQLDEARRVSAVTKAVLGQKFKSYEKWMNRFSTMPFPLSRTMLSRLQVGEKDVEALHSTDLDGLKTLIDIQGTAKQISAFTELEDILSGKNMVDGIATGGGFIAEIVGDVSFEGNFDIFTGSDRQGRRWLDLKQFIYNKQIQGDSLIILLQDQKITLLEQRIGLYEDLVNQVEPKWYENKYLWFTYGFLSLFITSEFIDNIK